MRPRIALPADTLAEATNIINERNAAFAPRPAIEAVVKAGGVPVIFPSVDPVDVPDYMDLFDGVAFLGGSDVDPTFYGEEPYEKLGVTYRKRDLFEIELLKQAVASGKAILGICRGMQLINVGLGGTLYQDLSQDPHATLKHDQLAPGNMPSHHISVADDSKIISIVGERPYVNSRHHEAVKDVAPNLRVVARADDQVVEAVESIGSDQIIGVQWHPENMYKHHADSKAIFADFIERSARVAESSRSVRQP
ncbi:gamma-glutamyl-gamma-aminobutyrate hydrolase family protein [Secundilactobacillus kimchicus]|uniref:Gamma-glutamyl-gamma-aminobutyrate hydrolase n=1 Tax=Secundilactobacillus kimchicus JCM 15530 TaxID=1302272 RepID=A0A0R1HWA6_9LACO|nr:gamma-glutamyl-gamma-aminobutyrate hydrolase family protein [Secundilactobacillus kimchicus]KRK47793.1 gamma-glutamyl-gamma-aminobutyrate hydrolase [Secundilactobacillus kimchicus JCM 15530]MBT9672541.1 gamma-glutamyl-gamma-aminobutyrate hydrolase family protein [Secundilactobacillus kimchicus]